MCIRDRVELREDACYQQRVMEDAMTAQFGADWRNTCGFAQDGLVPYAFGALLGYLHETQKHGIDRIKSVQNYADAQYMRLSPVTRANLELTETMRGREKRGTLLWALDKTETSMGKRQLRAWIEQPLVDSSVINQRLDAVEALYNANVTRADLKEAFSHVYDIERLTTRILYGSATPKEVKALGDTCVYLPQVRQLARQCTTPLLQELSGAVDPLEDLLNLINRALVEDPPANLKDGGAIRAGFNAEVDELRDIMHGGKGYLSNLEAKYREETGIPKLKIGYNHVFGYYIEVSNSYKSMVPETYIRKQTLTSGERYITQELKELESKILGAHERLITLERRLFDELLESISAQLDRIQRTANAVAELDVLAALAQVAAENNYCRPVVDDSDELYIVEGRHPVVEQVLKGSLFVPNDTTLNCGEDRCLIITGPNMAGKSTYMRQVALIVLMAQMGSFVPARSAKIGLVDRVFTRIGASDDLASGQSTFMVEMAEVATILKYATSRSLLILDEIGRGTSTYDGMAIARAVLEYAANPKRLGAKTLFATHYHELSTLEDKLPNVKNYNIAVKKRGEQMIFLRKIVPGATDDSYGIEVAKLAGIPAPVITRAREILAELESEGVVTAPAAQKEPEDQVSMMDLTSQQVVAALSAISVETLTPIEAMNELYKLKKMLD